MAREDGTLAASITTVFGAEEIRAALDDADEEGYGVIEQEEASLHVDPGPIFPGWFVYSGDAIQFEEYQAIVDGPHDQDDCQTVLSDLAGGLEQTKRLQRVVNGHENFVDLTEPRFNAVESTVDRLNFDFSVQYRE